ncbi:hypothetical protein OJ253_1868 [Cryptosporidium canis]|uniref:Uncharacterized protein n=1 Tax=Cryptosporidium canis TaxID=195482 RepID=A0A9D5DGM5_9CRYT|nr:hypothetical protein OJ253_1868 [Cryptosporidium canis]
MVVKEHEDKERFRPGDVFEGYYFPGVLCGRTLCYYRDVVKILQTYWKKVKGMGKALDPKAPGTFGILCKIFKETKFSAVQFCTEVEEREECFHILLGVIIRLFNRKAELDSLDESNSRQREGQSAPSGSPGQEGHEGPQGALQNSAATQNQPDGGGADNSMDLNVSLIILDSLQDSVETSEDLSSTATGLEELHHNVSIIYLLYLMFKSQYRASLEDGQEQSKTFEYMRIPVTVDTLKTIRKVVEECHKNGNIFPEVQFIVNKMIQEGILLVNLYNGPQYYYQDRYGSPLMPDPLEKRFLEIQDLTDALGPLSTKSQMDEEKTFTDYLMDLRTRLVQKVQELKVQRQKGKLPDKDQIMLTTLEKLFSEFTERVAEYELFKLKHSEQLDQIDSRVSEEESDRKRRKVQDTPPDHESEPEPPPKDGPVAPRNSLLLSENSRSEYGDWKELFHERISILEKASRDLETQQKQSAQTADKDCNGGHSGGHNKPVSPACTTDKDKDQEPDDSLDSILSRIEKLVNKEI